MYILSLVGLSYNQVYEGKYKSKWYRLQHLPRDPGRYIVVKKGINQARINLIN